MRKCFLFLACLLASSLLHAEVTSVEVTSRVVSYQRRRIMTGEVLGEHKLDLPERSLRTRAVWWTVTPEQVAEADLDDAELPGAAHAAARVAA